MGTRIFETKIGSLYLSSNKGLTTCKDFGVVRWDGDKAYRLVKNCGATAIDKVHIAVHPIDAGLTTYSKKARVCGSYNVLSRRLMAGVAPNTIYASGSTSGDVGYLLCYGPSATRVAAVACGTGNVMVPYTAGTASLLTPIAAATAAEMKIQTRCCISMTKNATAAEKAINVEVRCL
jgi:hypothetical protein